MKEPQKEAVPGQGTAAVGPERRCLLQDRARSPREERPGCAKQRERESGPLAQMGDGRSL